MDPHQLGVCEPGGIWELLTAEVDGSLIVPEFNGTYIQCQ